MRTLRALAIGVAMLVAASATTRAADYGPAGDVAAVRHAELTAWSQTPAGQVKVLNVRVVGDWAVLEWIAGQSGGMSAYFLTASGTWKRYLHDGGAFDARTLERHGCPGWIARELIPGSPG